MSPAVRAAPLAKCERMSGFVAFITTPQFLTGSFVSGLLVAVIGYLSNQASDRRNAKQEDRMQTRKEQREDKLRNEERLYAASTDFMKVATDALMTSIDIEGIFNAIRDMLYTAAGIEDPNAEAKFGHSQKVMDAQARIADSVNMMKLVAPPRVLDAVMRTTAALMTLARQTTEPFAKPVAYKAAADELNNFHNVFREEVGRETYANHQAQQQALSFMETLKKQVDAYMEEAKADMKAAGFKTTPWDKLGEKPASPVEEAEQPHFVGPTPSVPVSSLSVGDNIALPFARRGTGTLGLVATVRNLNDERTKMTVFIHNSCKTVELDVKPDQRFAKISTAA